MWRVHLVGLTVILTLVLCAVNHIAPYQLPPAAKLTLLALFGVLLSFWCMPNKSAREEDIDTELEDD